MNSKTATPKEEFTRPIVRVVIEKGISVQKEYFFKDTFRIGRDDNCAVRIDDGAVSREHLEISYRKGEWWVGDLFSSNGTYSDGKKVDHLVLSKPIKLELGNNGPVISLELVSEVEYRNKLKPGLLGSVTSYIHRYFDADIKNPNVGAHTKMMLEAFQRVKKSKTKSILK